jgi:photosystem II stability/assembly factor-like uncharacterized protein
MVSPRAPVRRAVPDLPARPPGGSLTASAATPVRRPAVRSAARIALAISGGVLILLVGGAWPASAGQWTNWLLGGTTTLRGVCFVSGVRGWTVGDGGAILTSSSGGLAWTTQASGDVARLFGVSFVDDEHGWAVGSAGTILATADGGASWAAQTSGTTEELRGVAAADPAHAWAVGAAGTILTTVDGGVTWTPQRSGTTATLHAVAFAGDADGIAVGADGTVVSTSDAGASWDRQDPGTSASLFGCTCAGGDAWAVGAAGTILASSDGGDSWEPQISGTERALRAVAAPDAAHVWAAGSLGTIVATADGGETWQGQQTRAANPLYGLSFSDVAHGWAVGGWDTVARYDTLPRIKVTGGGTVWHRSPVALTLTASVDTITALESMTYSLDAGTTWHDVPGSGLIRALTVSREGATKVRVRVGDAEGQSASAVTSVRIDTVRPQATVRSRRLARKVARGGVRLWFTITVGDPTPSCGRADLVTTLQTRSGRLIGRTRTKGAATNARRRVAVTLRRSLPRGSYIILVRATDVAGNRQARSARGTLRIF